MAITKENQNFASLRALSAASRKWNWQKNVTVTKRTLFQVAAGQKNARTSARLLGAQGQLFPRAADGRNAHGDDEPVRKVEDPVAHS